MFKQCTHNGITIHLEKLARVTHVRGRPVSRIFQVIDRHGEGHNFKVDYAIGVLDYRVSREAPAKTPDCALAGQGEKIISMPQLFDVLCAMTIPGYERTVLAPAKKTKAKVEIAPDLKAAILQQSLEAQVASQNPAQTSQEAEEAAIQAEEDQGLTRSDAQAVVQAKAMQETPIELAERIASQVDAKQSRRRIVRTKAVAQAKKKPAPKSKAAPKKKSKK